MNMVQKASPPPLDPKQAKLLRLALDCHQMTAEEGVSGLQWLRRQTEEDQTLWESEGWPMYEAVLEATQVFWQRIIAAAPTEAIAHRTDGSMPDGWLYTVVDRMRNELGMSLWEATVAELERRDRQEPPIGPALSSV